MTKQTLQVLGAIINRPSEHVAGSEIASITGLPSGTLYPILLRLEDAAWVESEWEESDPKAIGRPRRRLYTVTPLGAREIQKAFAEVRQAIGGLAWT